MNVNLVIAFHILKISFTTFCDKTQTKKTKSGIVLFSLLFIILFCARMSQSFVKELE